ncbi:MAG TPA: UDP-2,3-diacylglucosamine diphosphatase [Methylotenera sp.]|nr:UDP-2,3-diacylglucosamine diphosphatase [Methylotenera sp.]
MKNFGDDVDFETDVSLAQPNFTIFISDLHLCVSRPYITEAFLHFLKHTAVKADSLYILGDFFEYWAGDDDIEEIHHQTIIAALSALAITGVDIFFMHGNRDFLVSTDFCKVAKITLLQDPTLINLYGKKVLLSHGDDLCTDDVAYQDFRRQVREAKWQQDFLSQSLQARKSQIEAIRMRSEHEKSLKSSQIMDVNQQAVKTLLVKFNYPELFIHGHTHRPYEHHIELNGYNITRWVLGDWYEQGSYLVCDKNGCRSVGL